MKDFPTLLTSLSEITKFTKYSLIISFVRTIYFLAFNLASEKLNKRWLKHLSDCTFTSILSPISVSLWQYRHKFYIVLYFSRILELNCGSVWFPLTQSVQLYLKSCKKPRMLFEQFALICFIYLSPPIIMTQRIQRKNSSGRASLSVPFGDNSHIDYSGNDLQVGSVIHV